MVKRLASVETLGCTSVICSDKTGTLTLNQMTAVDLVVQLRPHHVTGEGWSPEGRMGAVAGDEHVAVHAALVSMVLCNDAVVRRTEDGTWELVGDPTEGALVGSSSRPRVASTSTSPVRAIHASPRCRSIRRTSSWPRPTIWSTPTAIGASSST